MSGTTAITAFFDGSEVCVANIGDSRAVIGEQKGKVPPPFPARAAAAAARARTG